MFLMLGVNEQNIQAGTLTMISAKLMKNSKTEEQTVELNCEQIQNSEWERSIAIPPTFT